MISGFVNPGEPLFMELNRPKDFKIRKDGTIFETYYFVFCESEFLNFVESIRTELWVFLNFTCLKCEIWNLEIGILTKQ